MDLIQSLQDDIFKPDIELSSILRKAKVLASILKNKEIKVWVDNELNGYHSEEELPEYRKFSAINRGDFIDAYGRMMYKNTPISLLNIPSEIRNLLMKFNLFAGVTTLEAAIKNGEKEFKYRWPAEILNIYSKNFYQNYICVDAWQAVSIELYEQVLDNIRTRLLDLLLELQEQCPDIEKSSVCAQEIQKQEVTRIFNTTVYGGQCSVGSNFENCQIACQFVQVSDLTSLLEYLKKIGVPSTEIENLKTSIQKDSQEGKSKGIGSNVKNWISNLSGKVLSGAFDKTLDVSLDWIMKGILAYYGLK